MIALRTLLLRILVPGTVTVLVPYLLLSWDVQIFSFELGPIRFLGLPPILLGALTYLWCAWDFTFTGRGTPAPIDPPKELVVKGLYRYTRNPMYVGVLIVLLGEALWFGSPRLLAYVGIVALFFHLFITLYEEPVLQRSF